MAFIARTGRAESGATWFRQRIGAVENDSTHGSDRGAAARLAPAGGRAYPRAHLTARLITPLALLAVAATLVCGVFAYGLARQSDDRVANERRSSLLGAVEEFRTVFADLTLNRAGEIATLTWLRGPLSAAETTAHIAPAGRSRYRPERSYLLDGDGRILASFPPGETSMPAAVTRLVDSFRAEEATRHRAAVDAPTLPGADIASVTSDFVMLDEHPALAAVATLRPVPDHGRQDATPPLLLAAVAGLDLRLAGLLEQAADVDALRFDGAGAEGGRETQSLIDRAGRIVGWMSWHARRPMVETARKLSPFLAVIALCFVGCAGLSFQQVGRANRQIAESEAQAHKIAYEDVLTGLANRRRILELLDQTLARRAGDEIVTLAYLDLDGFKDINDSLGHQTGDELLVAVARHLETAFPAPAVCGRFGGDEFAAVMLAADPQAAIVAANAAVGSMADGFWVNNQVVRLGVSIGLAQAPRDGTTHDDLLRHADLALRAAKRRGRACVVGFEAGMEQEFHDRQFITRELRHVLNEGGLAVHYQPIMAADGQHILGVEALLRWNHPTRGDIPPGVFVPVAEQTGMMTELGEFVLRRAFADAMFWPGVYVAVNLSPVQVRDRKLIGVVAAALSDTGLSPSRVVLEITEGVLIDDPEEAKERLEQLRALGVKIALDDFGSGYSSLSYLQRFPIDKLKIDKSFVLPLGRSPNGGVIIQAITALGRALGLTVVCEGVETEEQRILLRLAGCDEMQGFLFAKPGPRALIDRWLAGRNGAAAHGVVPAK